MLLKTLILAIGVVLTGPMVMAKGLNNVDNQADVNHPGIHGKVGDGTNANPNGKTSDGGAIHGIANVPGKSGADPSDGAPGFADQLGTVHGGIGDVNKNAD